MKIAIVGAGWAGMAAAVTAAEAGANVTVFEATRTLGGRARALQSTLPDGTPVTLDNGQHILIGAYTETLQLMRHVGVDTQRDLLRLPLGLPYPDGSGLQTPAWAARWPAPFNAVAAITCAKGWRWRDKLALVHASMGWQRSGFTCPPHQTVTNLCARLPARVVDELIDPLCVSALNTPAQAASAQVFLRVMQDALFGQGVAGFAASDLLLPRTHLSQLFPQTAMHWLQTGHSQTTQIQLGARVRALRARGAQWRLTGDNDGEPFDACFDQVIWATGAAPAAQAVQASTEHAGLPPATREAMHHWAASAGTLPCTAITTVYACAPGIRLPAPMLALHARPDAFQAPAQFVFDRGQLSPGDPAAQGVLAFVVSASTGDRAELQARVLQQAANQLGLHTLQAVQTVVEKRATFACTPGLQRPGAAITPGLWAAGDYIDGPYPATLEGAVRSGLAAARGATRPS